ncbi:MAG: class I SAM-dependent methyltransferase [Bacteroidales bacterium]|nr:class I SAM-dependent methyltransferase [Bacteroidales bacterium]
MNIISQCPICNSSIFSEFLTTQDYFLTNENFIINQCSTCGFKFTNPRPALDDLTKYYESVEYISHSNADKGLINRIYQIVRTLTLKNKAKLINTYVSEGQILDIGCGTGEFLNAMQQNEFIATGIEPNQEARKQAKKKYGLAVYDESDINVLSKKYYDVITLWHVLEHVFHLNERVSQIKELITEDGILVVALPNPASWDAKHYEKFWAAYDCPRHLYHFDQLAVKNLFKNYGFEIINQKPMHFDSFYVSMLSEKYKQSKLQFLNGLTKGFISNISAIFNQGNYSSIIYVLKERKA